MYRMKNYFVVLVKNIFLNPKMDKYTAIVEELNMKEFYNEIFEHITPQF